MHSPNQIADDLEAMANALSEGNSWTSLQPSAAEALQEAASFLRERAWRKINAEAKKADIILGLYAPETSDEPPEVVPVLWDEDGWNDLAGDDIIEPVMWQPIPLPDVIAVAADDTPVTIDNIRRRVNSDPHLVLWNTAEALVDVGLAYKDRRILMRYVDELETRIEELTPEA